MKEITFHVTNELHARYSKISKTVKKQKMFVNKVVPFFLVDILEADERAGFKKIREIWKKTASLALE